MAPQCQQHEIIERDLKEIKQGIKAIADRLGTGDVTFATLTLRVNMLEKVVYGAMGVAMSSLAMAILALVMK